MYIYIASTKKMLVEAITALLAEMRDCQICGTCDSLMNSQKKLQLEKSDVIVLTEPGFDCSTICALQKLQSLSRGIPVVLISCMREIKSTSVLFQHSVKAILTKECGKADLFTAIRMASMGKPYVTSTVAQALAADYYNRPKSIRLSPRQTEVIGYIAKGNSTSEIARKLSLSIKTVSAHKSGIKSRLNLRSTSQMVQYAIENNLVNT